MCATENLVAKIDVSETRWMLRCFDVSMGGYDGAEIAELVGIYILDKLEPLLGRNNVGIYRDDGIACLFNKSGPETDRMRKKIIEIFKENRLQITIETNLTVADFLDVTLDLSKELYYPFKKPNNEILYINSQSNHPPSIIKQLPKTIAMRFSSLSSNQDVFNKAKPDYEEALKKSGYNEKLSFTPKPKTTKKKRQRKIIWFNPPYSSNLKANIGKEFFSLLEKHFPVGSPLHKLFNRNNVKLSYSCMPNISTIMTKHNMKTLQSIEPPTTNKKTCNCRDESSCPLDGKCLMKSIIYKATVTTNKEEKFYLGCCETEFKTRYNNHKQTFKSPKLTNSTELSKYIWMLKEENKKYSIKWTIAARASPYACGTRKCDLCLTEKMLILDSEAGKMLNKRAEILYKCRHQNKYKLKNLREDILPPPSI